MPPNGSRGSDATALFTNVEERAVILLDRSLWSGFLEWVRTEMLGRGYISPRDLDWIHCVDPPQEALVYVKQELEKFRAGQEKKPDGAAKAAEATRIIAELEKKQAET
jgi:predicted Rossmann-fold nucleotide-binding protein